MRSFAKILIFALAVLLFGTMVAMVLPGCKSTQYLPAPQPDSLQVTATSITPRFIDTTVTTGNDSALVSFLYECDSNGRVMYSQISQQAGSIAHLLARVEQLADDSASRLKKPLRVAFTCKCDSQSIYLALKLADTTRQTEKIVIKNYPVPVPAQLTGWEKFKLATGNITIPATALLLIALIGAAAFKIFKAAKPV